MTDTVYLSARIPEHDDSEFAKTFEIVTFNAAIMDFARVVLGRRKFVYQNHPTMVPLLKFIAEDLSVNFDSWVELIDFQPEILSNDKIDSCMNLEERLRKISEIPNQSPSNKLEINRFSHGVFIGGDENSIQEYYQFVKINPKAKVIPVVSTGGAANKILELANCDSSLYENTFDYKSFFHYQLEVKHNEERESEYYFDVNEDLQRVIANILVANENDSTLNPSFDESIGALSNEGTNTQMDKMILAINQLNELENSMQYFLEIIDRVTDTSDDNFFTIFSQKGEKYGGMTFSPEYAFFGRTIQNFQFNELAYPSLRHTGAI